MEVAFFTDSYPPIQDGVSAVTGGLARTLARIGHSVRVFAPNPLAGPSTEVTQDGVTVRRIRTVPMPLYGQVPDGRSGRSGSSGAPEALGTPT